MVKNPSDVLAATPDRNQVPLLEGFGPGLLAKDEKDTRAHTEVFVSMYTLFAEGRLRSWVTAPQMYQIWSTVKRTIL